MSYGMQIRLSSGLTDVADVYTVRPKEEHGIDKGTGTISLYPNQDINYGSFTSLGIDYDSSTDAFFTKKFSLVWKANQTKVNFWGDEIYSSFLDGDLAHTLTLDDVNETVKLVWQNLFWTSVELIGSDKKLYVDFTIVKIKAS